MVKFGPKKTHSTKRSLMLLIGTPYYFTEHLLYEKAWKWLIFGNIPLVEN